MTTLAQQLEDKNRALVAQLRPIIEAYEKETGLCVESIYVRRATPFSSWRGGPIAEIAVHTNADEL